MSDFTKDPPIIRIVKKKAHVGSHGGAWKVAFADFVTAMMALFIVLWIMNQSEDMKRGVGGYFRDPTGRALLGAGEESSQGNARILGPMVVNIPTVFKRMAQQQSDLEEEANKLKELLENKEGLKELGDQISVQITKEGIRVEIAENDKEAIFERGSSRLTPRLIKALQVLAEEYAKLPAPVVIEGHTDSTPYSGMSGMSNWELSTQRANEARKVLVSAGLQEEKIFMIRGYADRDPIEDDPTAARNRRISMLLMSSQGLEMSLGSKAEHEAKNPAAPIQPVATPQTEPAASQAKPVEASISVATRGNP